MDEIACSHSKHLDVTAQKNANDCCNLIDSFHSPSLFHYAFYTSFSLHCFIIVAIILSECFVDTNVAEKKCAFKPVIVRTVALSGSRSSNTQIEQKKQNLTLRIDANKTKGDTTTITAEEKKPVEQTTKKIDTEKNEASSHTSSRTYPASQPKEQSFVAAATLPPSTAFKKAVAQKNNQARSVAKPVVTSPLSQKKSDIPVVEKKIRPLAPPSQKVCAAPKKSTEAIQKQPILKQAVQPTIAATAATTTLNKNNLASQTKPASNQKKTEKPKKNKEEVRSDDIIDDALLAEALSSLDTFSQSVNSSMPTQSVLSRTNSDQAAPQCAKIIGPLYAESREETSYKETAAISSHEACYIQDLVRRLQLGIRLSEPATIRITLTISSNGSFISCSFVNGQNTPIKHHLEKNLSSLKFAPFGRAFSQQSQHTFRLKIEDDGTWSL